MLAESRHFTGTLREPADVERRDQPPHLPSLTIDLEPSPPRRQLRMLDELCDRVDVPIGNVGRGQLRLDLRRGPPREDAFDHRLELEAGANPPLVADESRAAYQAGAVANALAQPFRLGLLLDRGVDQASVRRPERTGRRDRVMSHTPSHRRPAR